MTTEVVDRDRGAVRCTHRKFAIVGAGPGREGAPYGDPEWCVQALNEIPQRSYCRHWEMHPRSRQSPADMAALQRIEAPCYVLNPAEWWPGEILNAVRYPLERVRERTSGREYFTSTFAYQLALAVAEGWPEVGLWGTGLYRGSARERTAERACLEYWIGYAEGRGVVVTEDSGLARQPHLYGYDYDDEVAFVNSELARLHSVLRATERRCVD